MRWMKTALSNRIVLPDGAMKVDRIFIPQGWELGGCTGGSALEKLCVLVQSCALEERSRVRGEKQL